LRELKRLRAVLLSEDRMPNDQQIAILCDIGESAQFDAAKAQQVRELVAAGYVEPDGKRFKLTERSVALLADRGAGLNES
jgi:hypothetical protein